MKNSSKITLAFAVLAVLGACGDDKDSDVKDGGPTTIIQTVDSGTPVTPGTGTDSGTPGTGTDSGTPVTPGTGTDSGTPVTPSGDCFTGTPAKQEDFLNRCTTVASPTKTLAVPAALLNADGTVKPL
ncbi:MAG: hypothetical protein RLZZ450_780 [Pseudomonadota bacterium]|jgi:type VI secretion system secreted protein VgrG